MFNQIVFSLITIFFLMLESSEVSAFPPVIVGQGLRRAKTIESCVFNSPNTGSAITSVLRANATQEVINLEGLNVKYNDMRAAEKERMRYDFNKEEMEFKRGQIRLQKLAEEARNNKELEGEVKELTEQERIQKLEREGKIVSLEKRAMGRDRNREELEATLQELKNIQSRFGTQDKQQNMQDLYAFLSTNKLAWPILATMMVGTKMAQAKQPQYGQQGLGAQTCFRRPSPMYMPGVQNPSLYYLTGTVFNPTWNANAIQETIPKQDSGSSTTSVPSEEQSAHPVTLTGSFFNVLDKAYNILGSLWGSSSSTPTNQAETTPPTQTQPDSSPTLTQQVINKADDWWKKADGYPLAEVEVGGKKKPIIKTARRKGWENAINYIPMVLGHASCNPITKALGFHDDAQNLYKAIMRTDPPKTREIYGMTRNYLSGLLGGEPGDSAVKMSIDSQGKGEIKATKANLFEMWGARWEQAKNLKADEVPKVLKKIGKTLVLEGAALGYDNAFNQVLKDTFMISFDTKVAKEYMKEKINNLSGGSGGDGGGGSGSGNEVKKEKTKEEKDKEEKEKKEQAEEASFNESNRLLAFTLFKIYCRGVFFINSAKALKKRGYDGETSGDRVADTLGDIDDSMCVSFDLKGKYLNNEKEKEKENQNDGQQSSPKNETSSLAFSQSGPSDGGSGGPPSQGKKGKGGNDKGGGNGPSDDDDDDPFDDDKPLPPLEAYPEKLNGPPQPKLDPKEFKAEHFMSFVMFGHGRKNPPRPDIDIDPYREFYCDCGHGMAPDVRTTKIVDQERAICRCQAKDKFYLGSQVLQHADSAIAQQLFKDTQEEDSALVRPFDLENEEDSSTEEEWESDEFCHISTFDGKYKGSEGDGDGAAKKDGSKTGGI